MKSYVFKQREQIPSDWGTLPENTILGEERLSTYIVYPTLPFTQIVYKRGYFLKLFIS